MYSIAPPHHSLPLDVPGSNPTAVYVVDDDASYLRAACRLLRAADFAVRDFASGPQLLAEVSPETRGCVVTDLLMPGLSGLELQQALVGSGAALPVIFLTGQGNIASAVRAMREGAVDYLEKDAPGEKLIDAVRRALEREQAAYAARIKTEALRERFAALTDRELEVLEHVVHGKMNKEIAAELHIHERTVKLHRTAITSKAGVHSVAELTTLVREARLLEPRSPEAAPAERRRAS